MTDTSLSELLDIPDVEAVYEAAKARRRASARARDRRTLTDIRRVRASRVRQLRALEWRFDCHPTAAVAEKLRDLRDVISDLEQQMTELA